MLLGRFLCSFFMSAFFSPRNLNGCLNCESTKQFWATRPELPSSCHANFSSVAMCPDYFRASLLAELFFGVSDSPFSTFPSPEAITHRKQVEEKKFFGKFKKHNCVERADEELIFIRLGYICMTFVFWNLVLMLRTHQLCKVF